MRKQLVTLSNGTIQLDGVLYQPDSGSGPCSVEIMANCDRFYLGRETEVTCVVTN